MRLLTAVPICDGHDSAINTINLELIRHGIEVVYLGYHRPASEIVRAAVQEDVRAIGLSSYNGGHVEFFADVRRGARCAGRLAHVGLFGGGGGTITAAADADIMMQQGHRPHLLRGHAAHGYARLDQPKSYGTPAEDLRRPRPRPTSRSAERLTAAESTIKQPVANPLADNSPLSALSVANSYLLGLLLPLPASSALPAPAARAKRRSSDELVLRFLRTRPPTARVAILSHDPSIGGTGAGALLGDRATMIYSQKRPRVHALDGDARAVGRPQPIDGSVPPTPRRVRGVRVGDHRGRSARARKRCRFRANWWT